MADCANDIYGHLSEAGDKMDAHNIPDSDKRKAMLLCGALGPGILMFAPSKTALLRTSKEELNRLVFKCSETVRSALWNYKGLVRIWMTKEDLVAEETEVRIAMAVEWPQVLMWVGEPLPLADEGAVSPA